MLLVTAIDDQFTKNEWTVRLKSAHYLPTPLSHESKMSAAIAKPIQPSSEFIKLETLRLVKPPLFITIVSISSIPHKSSMKFGSLMVANLAIKAVQSKGNGEFTLKMGSK
jgi:hypothetical protein